MPELQRLRAEHGAAVLAFETVNRGYFAAAISDRGDAYFAEFSQRHEALLAEQEAGLGAFRVLVDEDGSILGRFNLILGEHGVADLGYRVARLAAGRGVATATVGELCGIAASEDGITRLRAATSRGNAASRRVLLKSGFTLAGPADPADLGGKPGTWFERDLAVGPARP